MRRNRALGARLVNSRPGGNSTKLHAYVSEAIDPISIFIGLTQRNLMAQAIRYLLFGEGETGLVVYAILRRYWDWTPEKDVRPLTFLMSD
jgi:hypothetical protein